MVNINRYEPLRRGFLTFVDLPADIQHKKAVVSIENKEEFCFLWGITAALCRVNLNGSRPSSYPHYNSVLKYEDIHFPIALKGVAKFEKMNNLSINL